MKTFLKVLIWIGSFIVTILAILIGDAIFIAIFPGYKMGYLIDLAITWFLMVKLPKRFCAMLDVKEFEKLAGEQGMTPGAYASTVFAPSVLELCESNKNNKALFENLMKQYIEGEAISKAEANVLRYVFCRRYGK